MKKKRKYPVLPNGYGSIRYLGKGRKNPYAVHPPAEVSFEKNRYVRPKALCYVDDWYVGFAVLNAFHAGTYHPGDEVKFKQYRPMSDYAVDEFCRRMMSDFTSYMYTEKADEEGKETFSQVYEMYYKWKYGENAKKKLSKQSMASTRAAYKNCLVLHNKYFADLRYKDLQDCIDGCPLKSASIENMVSLIKQMYKYAIMFDICEKNYSDLLISPSSDDEHGVPFSDEELDILWRHKDDDIIAFILVMCYSGYRIAAYKNMEVNTESWYFRGGVKTAAGKDRIVPVHTCIQELVKRLIRSHGCILDISTNKFRNSMYASVEALGMHRHTPHDCRHTFSRLCEKYKVNENDRKRMMGHSFGEDITNGIYGHRTLEELREEIEKIKCDQFVTSNLENM